MADSIQTAETLLEETSKIRRSCEKQYRENGTAYNVFTAAGIGTKEVPMCNVLADLLDPTGRHYRGELYLDLFMKKVVIPRIEKAEALDPANANVIREYPTDKERRIDIVIEEEGKIFIPIEVKIDDEDGEQQLADYAAFSKTKNPNDAFIPVLFLTPDGHPSVKAQKKDYVPISFEKDIIPWLEACLELPETKKDGRFEAALLIHNAVDEIYSKIPKIFTNQILMSVKEKFHDHANIDPEEKNWITIKLKGFQFSVYFDMKRFYVQKPDSSEPFSHERRAAIIGIMSEKIKDSNSAKVERENDIWVSTDAHYPGLENYDGERYIYELYKIYSDDPKQVADYIVSIAKELEKV